MALYTQLAQATITTTSVAINVPAGEVWMIHSLTLAQPAAGLAKEISCKIGAAATAANSEFGATFVAGLQRQILYPGVAVPAGSSFNIISSADTGVAVYTLNGFKQKTV
ncbi:MAG: hypothetical protein A2W26_12905 [Acidobacteria bacterium RBG_16_64_8]|nr:MAG: hypothetical protein A2W26_12905 [Acidobacteria bacterium RBG_16_64_8]